MMLCPWMYILKRDSSVECDCVQRYKPSYTVPYLPILLGHPAPRLSSSCALFTVGICSGDNHISVGVSPPRYKEYQMKLQKCRDIDSLFWETRSIAAELREAPIDNTSLCGLSRQQVNRDIIRERIIVNGSVFQSGEDAHALKLFLLDKVRLRVGVMIRSMASAKGTWRLWPF